MAQNIKVERIRIGDEVAPHYVRVVKAGNFVFLSGIGGRDISQDEKFEQDGGQYVQRKEKGYPPTVEEQMELMFKRAKMLLEKAGTSLDNVVFMRLFLTDIRDLDKVTPIMDKHLSNNPPASSVFGGAYFGRPNMRLECEFTAVVP